MPYSPANGLTIHLPCNTHPSQKSSIAAMATSPELPGRISNESMRFSFPMTASAARRKLATCRTCSDGANTRGFSNRPWSKRVFVEICSENLALRRLFRNRPRPRARTSRYPVTMLRALTMHALVLWDSGKSTEAWQKLREAAGACWSEYCSDQTLYSVYANMDNFAEDSMLWHVQMFALSEAGCKLQIVLADPDFLMRAVEHNRLAGAAMLAGVPSVAEENFKIAARLLAQAPQSDITQQLLCWNQHRSGEACTCAGRRTKRTSIR